MFDESRLEQLDGEGSSGRTRSVFQYHCLERERQSGQDQERCLKGPLDLGVGLQVDPQVAPYLEDTEQFEPAPRLLWHDAREPIILMTSDVL